MKETHIVSVFLEYSVPRIRSPIFQKFRIKRDRFFQKRDPVFFENRVKIGTFLEQNLSIYYEYKKKSYKQYLN